MKKLLWTLAICSLKRVYLLKALCTPTVAKGSARIRVMVSAAHTREDIDFGVEKFVSIGRKLGVIK